MTTNAMTTSATLDEQPASIENMARWNGNSKVDIHLNKRELFALEILNGIIAGYPPDRELDIDDDVTKAVEYADALLLELAKNQG